MPVHDWTRADDGMFHDFHNSWLTYLRDALNGGVLPKGVYAMTDQRADICIPDLIAAVSAAAPPVLETGGAAVAEPRTERRLVSRGVRRVRTRRRIIVRNARRVIAVIEVVSPGNKDGATSVAEFAGKVIDLVQGSIHVAVIDILPPGRHDPTGLHPVIWAGLDDGPPADPPPPGRPLTFASYEAGSPPVAYLDYSAVGQPLPSLPLYLEGDFFVNLPVEETYMTGYGHLPAELRAILG